MYDAFAKIDGGGDGVDENDDRRIEKAEFLGGYRKFAEAGFVGLQDLAKSSEADCEAVFETIDCDGGGMVLFSEFCMYVKQCEKDKGTALGKLLSGKTGRNPIPH
mmetsp:Transcript_3148/g.3595  ORF Transcript_3148/g.3595 Transcript_3148/m.3595 type:complete len:105 (-) Transcript_3148:19-333(-)